MTMESESPAIASADESAEASAAARARGGPFAPLRRRNFSLLFWGQLISMLGDQAYGLALPWTVLVMTHDARQMSVVLAAEALPRVIFLLIGGALSDRLNPRVVMVGADLGRTVVVGTLGVMLVFGLPPLWVIALLAALQGVGSGLFTPGPLAVLPRIVKAEELQAANGLMQIVQFLSLTLGPVLGGVATAAQAILAFLADAASFLVSALTVFGIRLPARQNATQQPVGAAEDGQSGAGSGGDKGMAGDIRAGIRYAFGHPLLRMTMFVSVMGNFALSGTFGVALIVLVNQLTHTAITLGLVLAAVGVGGILGGVGAALLARVRRRGMVALSAWGVMALAIMAVALVAGPAAQLPPPLDPTHLNTLPVLAALRGLSTGARVGTVAALLGLAGLILSLGDTLFLTIMQQRIAPEFIGRVFSVQLVAGGIGQPISLVLAGYIAATFGAGIVFLGAGALFLVVILIGFTSHALRQV